MAIATLSIIDYIILTLLLLLSAIIGGIFGFFKKKKTSSKEFFLGNEILRLQGITYLFFLIADGGMGIFPTGLSITVSFLSAITILGTPTEVYLSGTMFAYQGNQIQISPLSLLNFPISSHRMEFCIDCYSFRFCT